MFHRMHMFYRWQLRRYPPGKSLKVVICGFDFQRNTLSLDGREDSVRDALADRNSKREYMYYDFDAEMEVCLSAWNK